MELSSQLVKSDGITVGELIEWLNKCDPAKVVVYTHHDMFEYCPVQVARDGNTVITLEDIC